VIEKRSSFLTVTAQLKKGKNMIFDHLKFANAVKKKSPEAGGNSDIRIDT
jgi:hypothetical protein